MSAWIQRFHLIAIAAPMVVLSTLAGPAPAASAVSPGDVVLPADAGVINVKQYPFNAAGDGVTDDTAALQAALCGNNGGVSAGGGSVDRVVYLPAGKYLVHDTLNWCTGYLRYEQLQGQNAASVVIRLAPNSAGFADTAHPKPVISMTGLFNGQPVAGTATSFRNALYDLSVSVGSGNPGAVGVSYLASNQGSMRHINISADAGSGATGLDLTASAQGPAMINDVAVRGFATGIHTAGEFSTLTFERIALSAQRIVGFSNDGFRVSINGLTSTNTVPVISDSNIGSVLILLNGTLTGGRAGAAISTSGYAYLRNVSASGYARVLDVAGHPAGGGTSNIAEFTSAKLRTGTVEKVTTHSLALPVQATPDLPLDPPAAWVNVQSFGAKSNVSQYNQPAAPGDDSSAAIQAAIDSGATTVYLPNGLYTLRHTVHLRGKLARLYGVDSTIKMAPPLSTKGAAAFALDDGAAAVVTLERIDTDFANEGTACVFIEHNAARTLVLRNTSNNRCAQIYGAASGAGSLFVEDVAGTDWRLGVQNAWMRQVNPEGRAFPATPTLANAARKFTLKGTTGWFFGVKTEGNGVIGDVGPGSQAEFLGGFLANSTGESANEPAFYAHGGLLSVIGSENSDPYAVYPTIVRYQAGADLKSLTNLQMPGRFAGSLFLFNNAVPGAAAPKPAHDGSQPIQAENWDTAIPARNYGVCRGGVPDYSAEGLPAQAGTASCLNGGNWVAYKGVSLPGTPSNVTVTYASARTDQPLLELHLNSATGPTLARLTFQPTGQYADPFISNRLFGYFTSVTVPVSGLGRGTANLYLVAVADPRTGGVADVNALAFGGWQ